MRDEKRKGRFLVDCLRRYRNDLLACLVQLLVVAVAACCHVTSSCTIAIISAPPFEFWPCLAHFNRLKSELA